jgi:hypothetical protein
MGEAAIGALLWKGLLRVTKRTGASTFFKGTLIYFMKQFSGFATLAAASGGSSSSC